MNPNVAKVEDATPSIPLPGEIQGVEGEAVDSTANP